MLASLRARGSAEERCQPRRGVRPLLGYSDCRVVAPPGSSAASSSVPFALPRFPLLLFLSFPCPSHSAILGMARLTFPSFPFYFLLFFPTVLPTFMSPLLSTSIPLSLLLL